MKNTADTKAPPAAKRGRFLVLAAALVLCLSLQSCFTAGLWGTDLRGRDKAYLTPVTLTLDVITLPIQLAILDHGYDHHGDCR